MNFSNDDNHDDNDDDHDDVNDDDDDDDDFRVPASTTTLLSLSLTSL
jgi:hypothetical protein